MPNNSLTLSARRLAGGFTLPELLVTVLVLAILATMAAPSLSQFIASQRARNAAADLASAVTLTRSEAVNRNATITMTATGSWTGGWTVAAGTTSVRGYGPYNGIVITASGGTSLAVGNDGRPTTGSQTFQVAPSGTAGTNTTLCVQVSGTGRVATVNGACT
jgi:type IV fimbrial biogenesis protein FimT